MTATIRRYRKKPVVVEAVQLTADNVGEVAEFVADSDAGYDRRSETSVWIRTLEGEMRADTGDWVIRGVAREVYPCKPHIFEATYELVEDE
jgi:hypothetical protein